jgi:1-acyl-sn-glycerol-3-phosphate acyltransferase
MLNTIFQRWSIMARSLWVTFVYSVAVILYSLTGRLTREKTNRIIQRWSAILLRSVDMNLRISGQVIPKQIPGRRYILMSNHASHYDIPITLTAFSDYCIRMIAKKELFRVPLWGKAMRHAEFMSIDRENRKQALVDLTYAKEKLSSGITTWVAPEGTRTRSGEMGPLKKGPVVLAIETEAIIIPFAIRGSDQVLPPDTWKFKTGVTVEVVVGEPIDASQYTLKQRNELLTQLDTILRNLVDSKLAPNTKVSL